MLLLGEDETLIGMLLCSSGTFMPGQVIFLSAALGAGLMGVGSQVTVLRSYLLCIFHDNPYCTRPTAIREDPSSAHAGLSGCPDRQVSHRSGLSSCSLPVYVSPVRPTRSSPLGAICAEGAL